MQRNTSAIIVSDTVDTSDTAMDETVYDARIRGRQITGRIQTLPQGAVGVVFGECDREECALDEESERRERASAHARAHPLDLTLHTPSSPSTHANHVIDLDDDDIRINSSPVSSDPSSQSASTPTNHLHVTMRWKVCFAFIVFLDQHRMISFILQHHFLFLFNLFI